MEDHDYFKLTLQSQQQLIKDLEIKRNYDQINIKIDEMIDSFKKYSKTLDEPCMKSIEILIKSYQNKKSNIQ